MASQAGWPVVGPPEQDFAALLPKLIDAALGDQTPPIDLLLQRYPPEADRDPSEYVDYLEALIADALSPYGIRACRRVRKLVPGWSTPIWKTVYFRPSEEILFEALRDPHPVVLAMTVEPQRYIEAMLARAKDAGESRQIWIWKGASGRGELEQVGGMPELADVEDHVDDAHRLTERLARTSTILNDHPEIDADGLVASLIEQPFLADHRRDSIELGGNQFPYWYCFISAGKRHELRMLIDDRDAESVEQADEAIGLIRNSVLEEHVRRLADAESRPPGEQEMPVRLIQSFVNVLGAVAKMPPDTICIIPDAHHFLDNDEHGSNALQNISALKDAYHRLLKLNQGHKLVLLVGELSLPKDLREEALRIELPLPGRRELCVAIGGRMREHSDAAIESDTFDDEVMRLSEEAAGMTLAEVHSVLARASRSSSAEQSMMVLRSAKRRHISRTATLELVDTSAAVDLGGMDNFLSWLKVRRKVFSEPERAREIGIHRTPRGILLLGLPGSGKSLAAKVIAREWQLALVRLDIGSVRNKYVGSSEARIREALKVVEAMAPCILWVDEIDKGVGGGDNVSSSTADLNIKAVLLTWMQEHRYPVFIVATANRFEHLPPELTRAGRFDARFFFGCPGATGREDIFKVHLTARGYGAAVFDLEPLVVASLGFTGAEIEQAVTDSLYACFDREQKLSTQILLEHVRITKPLIRTAGKALDEVWDLVELGRVEPASSDMLTRSQVARLIDPYLYRPCYCRLDAIQGFEKQHADAARILMSSPLGGPAAAVMNTGEREWIYVEANFRAGPDDAGVFKFVDRFETIEMNFVFDTLVTDNALEAIYFEDEVLRKRFEESKMFSAYSEMFRDV